jgi:hypothetical protein
MKDDFKLRNCSLKILLSFWIEEKTLDEPLNDR